MRCEKRQRDEFSISIKVSKSIRNEEIRISELLKLGLMHFCRKIKLSKRKLIRIMCGKLSHN